MHSFSSHNIRAFNICVRRIGVPACASVFCGMLTAGCIGRSGQLYNTPTQYRLFLSLVDFDMHANKMMVPNFFVPEMRSSIFVDCFCQKTSFVSIRPHNSAHSGDSSTQHPTLPSWPSIRSFTWQGLETSSLASSRALDRPTPQRHWICSCQPLETDRPFYGSHGGATRQPELATR